MTLRFPLAFAAGCLLSGPALAGPCTDRITQVEKMVTARFEGSGPALAGSVQSSTTTPGAQPGGSGAASSAQPDGTTARSLQSQDESQAMNRLQQAKLHDQAGREGECMQVVSEIERTMTTK